MATTEGIDIRERLDKWNERERARRTTETEEKISRSCIKGERGNLGEAVEKEKERWNRGEPEENERETKQRPRSRRKRI